MQRREFVSAIGAAGVLSTLGIGASAADEHGGGTEQIHGDVENVILLIGDGMGYDPIEATDHVYGDLAMKGMTTTAQTETYPRGGEITGSAAAGTAIATGFKAYNGQVAVRGPEGTEDPDEVDSLTTMLEAAQAIGKSTGLVTTTRITHATPAVFASHVPDRGMAGEIAHDYIDTSPDVLLGAGKSKWTEDHLDRADEAGYEVLYDASDLENAGDGKLLGLFDESHLTYTLDRDDSHPSLPEMTAEAVDRLEENDDGFFVMAEAGRIDHAEHGNDGWTAIEETKEFDDTVRWALDYAEDRDDTLVVVTSDHETGGMAVGAGSYGEVLDVENIRNADASAGTIETAIADNECSPRKIVDEHLGIGDELSDEEVAAFEDGEAVAEPLSAHLGLGFAHGSHTGPGQVVLAEGPGVDEAEEFDGSFHHVDLSATLNAVLMFGGVDEVPEHYREQWERNVARGGASGVRDAYMALQYLGPVEDEVTSSLDVDGDGLVDLADVLRIYDEDLEPRTVGSDESTSEGAGSGDDQSEDGDETDDSQCAYADGGSESGSESDSDYTPDGMDEE